MAKKRPRGLRRWLILAAGGLLWRRVSAGWRLAVVHRPRHDDWSLPKGKLERGESFGEAALREVREETGAGARILRFAGLTFYLVGRRPKLAVFYEMQFEEDFEWEPGEEVDEVAWLEPHRACERLHYPSERRLVLRALVRREVFSLGPGEGERRPRRRKARPPSGGRGRTRNR
ncbi:MAG TPA: NUDIX hydrolase [Anaeromyxobacteraceae bacterium]|nr:NUDIX hydrolase [Anaeromyxobacteraceae bacterium]